MNRKGYTLTELLLVGFGLCLVLALFACMTLWTGRSLDWALTEWKHHPVHVPIWLAFLASVVGNGITFAFNVIVEILRRIA